MKTYYLVKFYNTDCYNRKTEIWSTFPTFSKAVLNIRIGIQKKRGKATLYRREWHKWCWKTQKLGAFSNIEELNTFLGVKQ